MCFFFKMHGKCQISEKVAITRLRQRQKSRQTKVEEVDKVLDFTLNKFFLAVKKFCQSWNSMRFFKMHGKCQIIEKAAITRLRRRQKSRQIKVEEVDKVSVNCSWITLSNSLWHQSLCENVNIAVEYIPNPNFQDWHQDWTRKLK